MVEDIRDQIFASIIDRKFSAVLSVENSGCISGVEMAIRQAREIGVAFQCLKKEGDRVTKGESIGLIQGEPKKIALAEERLIGTLAKYSGIASAARYAADLAGKKLRIVCGSWKKMPPEMKDGIRSAVIAGGASFRITDTPMLYLDKNFIRMFGSIPQTLESVKDFKDYVKVVQIRGEIYSVEEETIQAAENGAGILMVDTGIPEDLDSCLRTIEEAGLRDRVQIAYAGGILLKDIPHYCGLGVDMLCIGKEIVDAPLLDMKLDVQLEMQEQRQWA